MLARVLVASLLALPIALAAGPAAAQRAAVPPGLVALESAEGQRILTQASAREDFFHLVATYASQERASYCGVASAVIDLAEGEQKTVIIKRVSEQP